MVSENEVGGLAGGSRQVLSSGVMKDVRVEKGFLTLEEQRRVVEIVSRIEPGFYTPRTRFGAAMRVRMNCLGHHWSAKDYKYHGQRVDVDNLPCAPVPHPLQLMAQRALIDTGYIEAHQVRPYDVCIVNWYPEATGRLGDHVDNSESDETKRSGYPIVSLSVGAACLFRIGGLARNDPYEQMTLESGDVVIFGRSMRLAYHGVKKILPGTTPLQLGLAEPGRINLTFRIV